jgi:RNA polymerase sigma factor (TIGR02999 family)
MSDRGVTELLVAWSGGDAAAQQELLPRVYDQLREIAARHLARERPGHTLQATALVHEAFERFAGSDPIAWQGRVHFLATAAQLMRRILVDHARARRTAKRGGGLTVSFDTDREPIAPDRDVDLVRLDDALERLTRLAPTQARVVELRYFGGLTIDETAAAMNSSPATVKREWSVARAFLRRELAA